MTIKALVRRSHLLAAPLMLFLSVPAGAETFALANKWNDLVQLTAERSADYPTSDLASPAWQSADWVTEPAPSQYGPGAVYIRNAWRSDKYLTYQHEIYPDSINSTLVLKPKLNPPYDTRDQMLANGQVWKIEPVEGTSDEVRIRTAWTGFGMSYINIESPDGAMPAIPQVTPIQPGWYSARWKKFQSSHADPKQCIKNMSATVFTVRWYNLSDAKIGIKDNQIMVWPPAPSTTPVLSETKSLGFSSCENSSQRLYATVELVGKREVEMGVSFLVGGAILVGTAGTGAFSAAAGFAGMTGVYYYLQAKPNVVYLGIPPRQVTIKGTLFDASGTVDSPHDR